MDKKDLNYSKMKYEFDFSAEGIIKAFERERGDRGPIESQWREIARYVIPRKSNIQELRPIEQKPENEEVYDDTAIQANITLSNGLQSNLTPPNVKWFNLRAKSEEANQDEAVKEEFSAASNQLFKSLTESNFSEQIHEDYQDLGSIGDSCIFVDEDDREDFRFFTLYVPNNVYYWEDSKKRVNKVIRVVEYTTMQALEEFGENSGEKVLECYKDKKYDEKHTFLHCVSERHSRDVSKKTAENKPFLSLWVSVADKKIVREGGYDEFPFFFGRFYKGNYGKYGISPASLVLPSIKSVNQLQADSLQASRLTVRPPLDVPYKGYFGELNLNPGKANHRRQGIDGNSGVKPIITGVDPNANEVQILRLQDSIKRAYFVNMFLALEEKTNMTATEVAERVNEKMSQLGPALKRLENEKLRGILHRCLMILIRRGKIRFSPETFQKTGGVYDISYTSRLELAQKVSEIQSVDQFVLRITNLAQVDPSALDVLNTDETIKFYEGTYNVPPLLTRRPEEVEAIRAQRAEQAQQQAMLQGLMVGSQAMKNFAGAEKDSNVTAA